MTHPKLLVTFILCGIALPTSAVGAGAATPPLVDVEWVKSHACEQNVVVLDTRNDKIDAQSKAEYLNEHIPCSVHTDYAKAGWRVKAKEIAGMLPPVDKLEHLIGGLGIDNDTHVIVAGAGNQAKDFASAARAYWTFRVLGHDKVSILNGGVAAYAKDKANAMETGDRVPEPKQFKADPQTEMLVTADDVSRAAQEGVLLVDLRPSDMYLGINKSGKVKRPGTIPGAVNLPRPWLTANNKGRLRSKDALNELLAVANVPNEGKQITFCNTGHDSSIGWFVLSEIVGNKSVQNYDGSLAEWASDLSRPMESKIALTQ